MEQRTREIGRELFAAVHRHRPWRGSRRWFDDQAMAWTMRDERIKIQLFRFVDALPGLRTPGHITRHLGDYLAPVSDRLPHVAAAAVRALTGARSLEPVAAWLAGLGVRQLARRFIVGSDVQETVAAVGRLRARQLASTVDLLGEAILSEQEASRYQVQYLELVEALATAAAGWTPQPGIDRDDHGDLPRVNVSIKLSALTGRFEPCDPAGTARRVLERLRPILALARRRHVFVNIDMEQSSFRATTFAIFMAVLEEEEFRTWGDVGIAVQTYLTDTEADLEALYQWARRRGTPCWVRLVKGAYWDYERAIAEQNDWPSPVHTAKSDTDAAYERLAAWLIERRTVLKPAFASHNVRSIARVLALAEHASVPPHQLEFQMLYGMADALLSSLAERGERVRVYAPFGELLPGMAYLVRRLLENTSNQSFVRAGFLERSPQEHLLMDPATLPLQPLAPRGDRFRNQAPLDFTLPGPRTAMRNALEGTRGQAETRWTLHIGASPVETTRWLERRDPSHAASRIGWVGIATAEQASAAVSAAAAAFPSWRDTPVVQRAGLLRRAAELMVERRYDLSAWIVREVGKTWREADADVCEAVDFCRYYAHGAERLARAQRVDLPGEENDWFYEPRGVTVIIAPWNFPIAILCGMTAAALAVGCTAVMKPAEQSSLIGCQLMDIFRAAGFPAGVVNLINGIGEEVGPVLLNHPATAVAAFTGSRDVGLMINRQAALLPAGRDHLVRVIAELGGKNAIIVDEDADLDEAVAGVMHSAFGYQGQKCSACSRAIVLEGVYPRFLERLIEATRAWELAPAEDPSHGIGPLIDEEARRRVLNAIERGRGEAELVYAGDAGRFVDEGFYVAPHIFAPVEAASFLAQEEIFGPVLAVMRATDLTHALAIANGTQYALTGGCFSRSPTTLERVRREFRVGNLYLNRRITGALVGRQPFGGFKLSGTGTKAGGPDYLLHFVLPRTVTENTMRHGFAPERTSS